MKYEKIHTSYFIYLYLFFAVVNKASKGKISNLPHNIPNDKTIFESVLNSEKFDMLKHSPTLAKVVITEFIVVSNEYLSNDTIKIINKINNMYKSINVFVFTTISSETFLPSNFTVCTLLG